MGWKGFLIGGPIISLAEEVLSSDRNNDRSLQPIVSESEVEKIQRIIKDGRLRGVSEIDIEISQNFAENLDLNSAAAIETIPISVGAHVNRNRAGKFVLHVKYLPPDITDCIEKLHRLHKEGALTDEEFEQAKQKILFQF